jgi:hypothetical protein
LLVRVQAIGDVAAIVVQLKAPAPDTAWSENKPQEDGRVYARQRRVRRLDLFDLASKGANKVALLDVVDGNDAW